MKKLYILAALLMATTSAHAGGISFQINGERVRVEAPRNCNAHFLHQGHLARLYRHARQCRSQGHGPKSKDDDVVTQRRAGACSGTRAGPATAPQPPARCAAAPAPAQTTVAAATPARTEAAPPAPPPPPAPVAAAPRPQPPAPVAAAAASDPNSPLGIWATEENKGNVRIEECGANLCGYSVNTGEKS